jgi:hypothetical protein
VRRFIALLLLLSACDEFLGDAPPAPALIPVQNTVEQRPVASFGGVPVYERKVARTLENVEFFNLETPIRCKVDWDSQNIISTQPFDADRFYLERVDKGDPLPDITVEDLSFKDNTVDGVLQSLLKNTEIEVDSRDRFTKKISMKGVGGRLSNVVDLIVAAADVYYSYDDRTRTITLRRHAKWNLHVPLSDEVLLAAEDALKGSDVDDIVIDWEDRVLIFQGDIITEGKVRDIINKFAREKYLMAYDIDVYRVRPKEPGGAVEWMAIVDAFNRRSVRLSKSGIIGRLFVVGSNFNRSSLAEFFKSRADVELISTGRFAIPERWQGRFDIGQCSREPRLETDLQVLSEARFTPQTKSVGKLDTTIVLKTREGQIAQYSVPSRLGDNFLIVGIPTQYFAAGDSTPIAPNSELVVLLSPRIINIVKPLPEMGSGAGAKK